MTRLIFLSSFVRNLSTRISKLTCKTLLMIILFWIFVLLSKTHVLPLLSEVNRFRFSELYASNIGHHHLRLYFLYFFNVKNDWQIYVNFFFFLYFLKALFKIYIVAHLCLSVCLSVIHPDIYAPICPSIYSSGSPVGLYIANPPPPQN